MSNEPDDVETPTKHSAGGPEQGRGRRDGTVRDQVPTAGADVADSTSYRTLLLVGGVLVLIVVVALALLL